MPGLADSFSPRVNFSKTRASMPAGSPGRYRRRARARTTCRLRVRDAARRSSSGVPGACISRRSRTGSRRAAPSAPHPGAAAADRRAATPAPDVLRQHALAAPQRGADRFFEHRPLPVQLQAAGLQPRHVEQIRDDAASCAALLRGSLRDQFLGRIVGDCGGSRARASIDAKPTIDVSGVRRSCEIADSSELRKRSDSMLTSASCAIST